MMWKHRSSVITSIQSLVFVGKWFGAALMLGGLFFLDKVDGRRSKFNDHEVYSNSDL